MNLESPAYYFPVYQTGLPEIIYISVIYFIISSVDRRVCKITLIEHTNVSHKSEVRFSQEFSENLQIGLPFQSGKAWPFCFLIGQNHVCQLHFQSLSDQLSKLIINIFPVLTWPNGHFFFRKAKKSECTDDLLFSRGSASCEYFTARVETVNGFLD